MVFGKSSPLQEGINVDTALFSYYEILCNHSISSTSVFARVTALKALELNVLQLN